MALVLNGKLGNLPPREKALSQGLDSLSDVELFALLLGQGTKGINILQFCQSLLSNGLANLANCSYAELVKITGIKKARALKIMAIINLSKRINATLVSLNKYATAENLYLYFQPLLADKCQEHFVCVFIDSKNYISGYRIISIGTINAAMFNPADVFREAIRFGAAQIAIIHNHPSGDPTPSKEDINITKALIDIGMFINICVVDHIIIGKNKYASLKNMKKISL